MTTVVVPKDGWQAIKQLFLAQSLPSPLSAIHDDVTSTVTVSWEPALTAPQVIVVTDMVAAVKSRMSYEAYASIKAEIPTLRNYVQTASPSNAQTAAATKSIIRVLRQIIRD